MFLWPGVPGYLVIVPKTFASMTISTVNPSQGKVDVHQLVPGQHPASVVMLYSIHRLHHHPSTLMASISLWEKHSKFLYGTEYTFIITSSI